jgi:elongation factor G
MVSDAEEWRKKLVEDVVDQDDDVYEKYLDDEVSPDIETLKRCLRKGTINMDFFPDFLWFIV